MKSPTVSTLKTLFALSGNRCAFPKCTSRLVEESSGTLVGKVCHIKGKSSGPGSKRHDKNQTDEERHGSGNLIALCPKHHDVIDDDEVSYTVERLTNMKADHEAMMREEPAASDNLADKFAVAIYNNTVTGGSIIHNQHQTGGQAAHSIVNNYAPAERQIGPSVAEVLVSELRKHPREEFHVTSRSSGTDTMRLARKLQELLLLAGWGAPENLSLAISPDTQDAEVVLSMPDQRASFLAVLNWLQKAGMKATGQVRPELKMLEISIAEK